MELLVCGTAAAEGWPALFCTCDACMQARELGGKDLRSRAAYMVGERVRVDFGPDSFMHQQAYGLAYEKLEHLLVTHSHDDHWVPRDLNNRRCGLSVVPNLPLKIHGNLKVERKYIEANSNDWEALHVVFHRIVPWEVFDLGDGLQVTALLSAHDRTEDCMNFLFEYEGRYTLIGHDTGWYDEAAWEHLEGKPLSTVLLDCTYGPKPKRNNHMGCDAVVEMRDEFARRGGLADNAQVFATHFSHNGGWLHAKLEEYFQPHGIQVAYDGLRVEI